MENLSFNIFQVLILLGAVNGLVWGILIFRNRVKRKANIYLALFVLAMAVGSLKIVLQEKIPNFNLHLPFPLLLQFCFGPLLYFYIRASLSTTFKFSYIQLWHFVPSLLLDVLPAMLLFAYGIKTYSTILVQALFIIDILAFIAFSIYWVRACSLIFNYYKTAGKAELKWLVRVIAASFFIVLSWLAYIIISLAFKHTPGSGLLPYQPIYLVLCACMYWLGIAGYYRPEAGLLTVPVIEKRQLLSADVLSQKMTIILNLMSTNHWHHDEHINLSKLAAQLQMPVNELSYILNSGFKMNFSDFINQQRIEDLKIRFADKANEKYTLLGMAYEVGFSSKASFYRAFKKATQKTPGEYYKQQYSL
ncbi:helix-turn-helix domain-containing protein [Mucilaginibacter sp. UYCu711]|uniref:helix-turn-helix domain-containing protein n=1 Tax=Mucilaginibacter sp. UYCu711 TaxID=3156339 RepID=UPI003D20D5ED